MIFKVVDWELLKQQRWKKRKECDITYEVYTYAFVVLFFYELIAEYRVVINLQGNRIRQHEFCGLLLFADILIWFLLSCILLLTIFIVFIEISLVLSSRSPVGINVFKILDCCSRVTVFASAYCRWTTIFTVVASVYHKKKMLLPTLSCSKKKKKMLLHLPIRRVLNWWFFCNLVQV